MNEFTGERVIPGQVDDELWDEHIARYAFAARFATGKRVLDLGCGVGYGTEDLARAAQFTVGLDLIPATGDALFLQGSACDLPFRDRSFDLITAFEVIEHLQDWDRMLGEARRVLRPDGAFLVSTPNKKCYAESRAAVGPNPFHVHEFEFDEFEQALGRHFASVTIYLQNRAEAFVFAPAQPSPYESGLTKATSPEDAQFFVAVCSHAPMESKGFVHLPTTANLLRERELHIHKLEDELALSKKWLADTAAERDQLLTKHAEVIAHLEEQNRWAQGLEKEWKAGLARITQLQDEFQAAQSAALDMAKKYEDALSELRSENEKKTRWAIDTEERLTKALGAKCEELAEAVKLLDRAEATVTERTEWAQALQRKVEHMERQLQMIRDSRWVKLGRTVGLGPQVGPQVNQK